MARPEGPRAGVGFLGWGSKPPPHQLRVWVAVSSSNRVRGRAAAHKWLLYIFSHPIDLSCEVRSCFLPWGLGRSCVTTGLTSGCSILNVARQAAATMTETLKCPRRQKIDVVGVTPLDEHGVPTSPGVGVCSYIAHLLPVVQDKCNGRRRCKLRAGEVAVSKKQCPGVASVNFRVECVKRGIPFSFFPARRYA